MITYIHDTLMITYSVFFTQNKRNEKQMSAAKNKYIHGRSQGMQEEAIALP